MTTPTVHHDAAARLVRRVENRAQDGRDWCSIVVNKAAGAAPASADVMLYDEIGFWGTTAKDFASQLAELDVSVINLRINSPGGEVYDGIAILNALREHDATVNVTVDGIAASSASFIAMAGDTITMARNAEMMIHDASGLVIGGPGDMAQFAQRLEQISNNIASIYADRTSGTVEEWRAAMTAETWYSAQEAVDAGLADKVIEPKKNADTAATNRFDLTVFNHAGRAEAPAPANLKSDSPSQTPAAAPAGGSVETPTKEGSVIVAFSDESTTTLRQKLGVAEDADEATILAALDEALDERSEPQDNGSGQLPEGVVAIDATTLQELRNHAEAGRQAREQQAREQREAVVNSAIKDGRIAPARREAWLNRIAADPEEVATLNSLEKGLSVPTDEIGVGDTDDNTVTNQPFSDSEATQVAAMLGVSKEAVLRG